MSISSSARDRATERLCRENVIAVFNDSSRHLAHTPRFVIAGAKSTDPTDAFTLEATPSSPGEARHFLDAVAALFRAEQVDYFAMVGPRSFMDPHSPGLVEGELRPLPLVTTSALVEDGEGAHLSDLPGIPLPLDHPLNLLRGSMMPYQQALAFLQRCRSNPERFVILGGTFGDSDTWSREYRHRGIAGARVVPGRAQRWR